MRDNFTVDPRVFLFGGIFGTISRSIAEAGFFLLFESGSIVMHIAEQAKVLMPAEADARARVKTWMFAALNTVEPPIMMLSAMDLQPGGVSEWAKDLRDSIVKRIQIRLDSLAQFLA